MADGLDSHACGYWLVSTRGMSDNVQCLICDGYPLNESCVMFRGLDPSVRTWCSYL
jgi:hypothetical protein